MRVVQVLHQPRLAQRLDPGLGVHLSRIAGEQRDVQIGPLVRGLGRIIAGPFCADGDDIRVLFRAVNNCIDVCHIVPPLNFAIIIALCCDEKKASRKGLAI